VALLPGEPPPPPPARTIAEMKSLLIPHAGGWFALLVLLHFSVDWILQSHDEAMRKPREWRVRARHCLVYTVPFAALLSASSWHFPQVAAMSAVLFLSHFVEDTYLPVLWWAKYVRRPPQMARRVVGRGGSWSIVENGVARGFRFPKEVDVYGQLLSSEPDPGRAQRDLDMDGFISFVSEPLGKILLVAVDQIVHLVFLLPAAFMLAAQP